MDISKNNHLMTFPFHSFEIGSGLPNTAFTFQESLGEGQELYFLAKFHGYTNASESAEKLFGTIIDNLQNSKVQNIYDKFEDALKIANQEAQLWQNPDGAIDVAVAYFDFHHLYLSQSGQAESYLVRDHIVSQISEANDTGHDLFLNILSGQVAIEDTVVLSSDKLLPHTTSETLTKVLQKEGFNLACDDLQAELESQNPGSMVIACVGVGKQDAAGMVASAGFLSKVVSSGEKVLQNTASAATSLKDKITADHHETDKTEISPEPTEYVEPANNQQPSLAMPFKPKAPNKSQVKIIGMVAAAVFGLFILKMGLDFVTNFESQEDKNLRENLSIAREALQQADTFLIQGERQTAKEYISTAEKSLNVIMKSSSKNFRADAQYLMNDVKEKQLMVENAKKSNPVQDTDLGLKNANVEALGLLELRGNMYVNTSKEVFKTVRNIVENPVKISEKETVIASTTRADQNTLMFLTDSPRIIEYREGIITPMNTSDQTWKRGIDIKTYGKFAYLLDPSENQIWKYERRRSGFSGATAYNQDADLGRAVSFTIDGSVYVLEDDGGITKIFRGKKQDYEFSELPSVPFAGNKTRIYTTANLDSLFVLDPDNQRILIFAKGDRYATYRKQIIFDLEDARDFYIDESGQKADVLTSDKIYSFSL